MSALKNIAKIEMKRPQGAFRLAYLACLKCKIRKCNLAKLTFEPKDCSTEKVRKNLIYAKLLGKFDHILVASVFVL